MPKFKLVMNMHLSLYMQPGSRYLAISKLFLSPFSSSWKSHIASSQKELLAQTMQIAKWENLQKHISLPGKYVSQLHPFLCHIRHQENDFTCKSKACCIRQCESLPGQGGNCSSQGLLFTLTRLLRVFTLSPT